MFTSEALNSKRRVFEGEVNMTLNAHISKSLGKQLFTDEDIEDGNYDLNFLTFVNDEVGSNHDFIFMGIDEGGNILGIDEDGKKFGVGTIKINNILLRCKIEIIEMLEQI